MQARNFHASYQVNGDESGVALSWQILDGTRDSAYAFWIAGHGDNDGLGRARVEFGHADGDRVEIVGSLEGIELMRFAWVRVDRWTSHTFRRPPGLRDANRIRLVIDPARSAAFEVSPITVLPGVPLELLLRKMVVATHVDLRPFFPCTREAKASRGLMQIPDAMLVPEINAPNGLLLFGTSTFHMMSDAFEFPLHAAPASPSLKGSVGPQMSSVALAIVDRTRLAQYQPVGTLMNSAQASGDR